MLVKTNIDSFNFIYLNKRNPSTIGPIFKTRIISQCVIEQAFIPPPFKIWMERRCRLSKGWWSAVICLRIGNKAKKIGYKQFVSPVDFNFHSCSILQMKPINVDFNFVKINPDLKLEETKPCRFRVLWNAGRRTINKSVLLCERVSISNPSLKAFGICSSTGESFVLGNDEVYFELETETPFEAVNRNQFLFEFEIMFSQAVNFHVNF